MPTNKLVACYTSSEPCYNNQLHVIVLQFITLNMLLLQAGDTALHLVCSNGHTELVKLLLNNKAEILATNKVSDKAVAI